MDDVGPVVDLLFARQLWEVNADLLSNKVPATTGLKLACSTICFHDRQLLFTKLPELWDVFAFLFFCISVMLVGFLFR